MDVKELALQDIANELAEDRGIVGDEGLALSELRMRRRTACTASSTVSAVALDDVVEHGLVGEPAAGVVVERRRQDDDRYAVLQAPLDHLAVRGVWKHEAGNDETVVVLAGL